MLTGLNSQIVTAFDELEMNVDEIASEFGCEPLSVKACLMSFSSKYRSSLRKQDVTKDFKDEELEEANAVIVSLMRTSDDEHLRGRMARYIRDDKKGRLDALNGIKSMNVNIALFNERLLQAKEAKQKSKETQQIEDADKEQRLKPTGHNLIEI